MDEHLLHEIAKRSAILTVDGERVLLMPAELHRRYFSPEALDDDTIEFLLDNMEDQ